MADRADSQATEKPAYNPVTGQMEVGGERYDPAAQAGYIPSAEPAVVTVEKTIAPAPTPTDASPEQKREQILRETVASAEEITEVLQSQEESPTEFLASVEDIKQKLGSLEQAREVEKSYRETGQEIPAETRTQLEQMKAVALSPAAPFIDFTKGTVDVATALRMGISEVDLQAIGVTESTIASTKSALQKWEQEVAEQRGLVEAEREALVQWEKDVLPTLPKEYQEAYKSGGIAGIQRLQQVSQQDYDTWFASLDPKYQAIGESRGHDAMVQAIEAEYRGALDTLRSAGFVEGGVPKVWMGAPGTPTPRTYTVPNLAEFVRRNPDGIQVLRTVGFDDKVISAITNYNKRTGDLVAYLDKGVALTGTGLARGLGLSSGEISALDRALSELGVKPVSGSYIVAWRQLDDDKKRLVATVFEADWSKGSPISAFAKDIEKISETGIPGMLLTAPVQPITTPIGKQLTLKDAKAQLAQTYETELASLSKFVKPNGTFDIKKLDKAIVADPNLGKDLLERTGYKNTDSLKQSLEYYNYGSRVSAKEWTVGGLVAALNVLGLGAMSGATILPANLVGRVVGAGIPLGLATLIAPDIMKTIKDPEVGIPTKVLAGAIETALIAGGLIGLRPTKAMLAKVSPVGKVEVPLETPQALLPKVRAVSVRPSTFEPVPSPVVWRGIKLGDTPVIGISKGKLAVGAKGIEFPPLHEWKLPYKEGTPFEPRTGLETRVLVNKSALDRAGMGVDAVKFTADIDKTLAQVHKFYGKKAPGVNAELLSQPIDTLSQKGIEALLKWVVKNKNIVDRVYGSSTARPQLSKAALDEWLNLFGRKPGDVDLMLKNVTQAQGEAAVRDLVAFIRRNSPDRPWVSATKPTLVEHFSRSSLGATRHAIDVHLPGEPLLTGSPLTAEMVYGLRKTFPAIKVKVKGVGDIQVSRLSETGVGKTEQVLGWRRDSATGKVILKTEGHRLKDYVDLYEIVKTYNGQEAADTWALETGVSGILSELSAKATGAQRLAPLSKSLSSVADDLAKIRSDLQAGRITSTEAGARLRTAQKVINSVVDDTGWTPFGTVKEVPARIELARTATKIETALEGKMTPARLASIIKGITKASRGIDDLVGEWPRRDPSEWAWTFSPSKGRTSTGAISPVISLVSASLVSALRSPIIGITSAGRPVSIPSRVAPSIAPSLISPRLAPSEAPSVVISPKIEPSSALSVAPSPGVPSPAPSPVLSPEPPSPEPPSPVPPSPKPPSLKPSPAPSPTPPSPTPPSVVPLPTPPSPELPLVPEKPLPTSVISPGAEIVGKEAKLPKGSIAWRQGIFWKYIPPPWDMDKAITLPKGVTPVGAVRTHLRTAKDTVQRIGKAKAKVPKSVSADLGVVDLEITDSGDDIAFSGGGLATDVGERIGGPAQGVSIPSRGLGGGPSGRGGYRRKPMPQRKKRRKLSEWDYMTTLKGFRP